MDSEPADERPPPAAWTRNVTTSDQTKNLAIRAAGKTRQLAASSPMATASRPRIMSVQAVKGRSVSWRKVMAAQKRGMRTVHGEERARREEQQHVHDDVEPNGSGSIPVDEAHDESEGHGCSCWVSGAESCVGMVPVHSLVIEMVKTSIYRGRPLRHHAVQCMAAEQPYRRSAITAGQISGIYPAMIRSPSACGWRCGG